MAFVDGKPVGFIIVERRPYRKCGDFNIAVDPSRHGVGIGSTLLRKGLSDLVEMGATTVIADFLLLNVRAQNLYRKHGFHVVRSYNYYPWNAFQKAK